MQLRKATNEWPSDHETSPVQNKVLVFYKIVPKMGNYLNLKKVTNLEINGLQSASLVYWFGRSCSKTCLTHTHHKLPLRRWHMPLEKCRRESKLQTKTIQSWSMTWWRWVGRFAYHFIHTHVHLKYKLKVRYGKQWFPARVVEIKVKKNKKNSKGVVKPKRRTNEIRRALTAFVRSGNKFSDLCLKGWSESRCSLG